MLGIATTFLVCVVLASGAMILTRITSDLVITPIENMITKVRRISENPLKAAHEEENEALAIEEHEAMEDAEREANPGSEKGCLSYFSRKKQKEAPLETVVLEQTLIKIGGLLALGFGEAGS